jgi:site-specific DNA-cytosine methylase
MARVLVACEFSGTVRDAYRRKGHDAWSCDLLPCDADPTYHYQQDVFEIIDKGWDIMIAHPPCTHLASSGARWFKNKQKEQAEAIDFFMKLMNANIPKIAVENPVGIMSTKFRKPDCIVNPWQFGDPYQKTTCFWLKNLPPLVPTKIMPKDQREQACWKLPPSKDRWKLRSITYPGIAEAISTQWN